jgi:hypothetical protein
MKVHLLWEMIVYPEEDAEFPARDEGASPKFGICNTTQLSVA